MSHNFGRTLVTTAAVVGLSGCAAVPAEHHWVSVKPVRSTPRSELTQVDGDYAAAVAAIDRRDYGLALDLLQTANARKGDDVRILNAFGVVYDKLGRFDLSSRYYARAHAADANSAIVASNEAYSAMLQGDARSSAAAPAVLARAATPAPARLPAAVMLSPAPLAEAPQAPALTLAPSNVFRTAASPAIRSVVPPVDSPAAAPVRLAAAPNIATPARLSPAPVAEAAQAPALALRLVHSLASPNLLKILAQYLTPAAEEHPSSAPVVRSALPPTRLAAAPRTPAASAGPPILLASVAQANVPQVVAQPGVVRLAAISPIALGPVTESAPPRSAQRGVIRLAAIAPNAVQQLPPVRRRGLEIADASGRPGAAAPIRLQLAQLGWTTHKGPIAVAPRISRTTITYAAYRAPVALSLARTLPRGVRLVDCGSACGGIRLTLGSDSLSWPSRIRAVLRAFG